MLSGSRETSTQVAEEEAVDGEIRNLFSSDPKIMRAKDVLVGQGWLVESRTRRAAWK